MAAASLPGPDEHSLTAIAGDLIALPLGKEFPALIRIRNNQKEVRAILWMDSGHDREGPMAQLRAGIKHEGEWACGYVYRGGGSVSA
jgi:hypothetical protein